MREVRRLGVDLRTADIDTFAWQPALNRITLAEHLDTIQARCVLTLALAHKALGHETPGLRQDLEARALCVDWLLPDSVWLAAVRTMGLDPWAIAEHCVVTRNVVRVRLGWVCDHMSNWRASQGVPCEVCAPEHAAA